MLGQNLRQVHGDSISLTETLHRPILILGTRMLALELADVLSEIPDVEVAGFVENLDIDRCSQPMEGMRVYWIAELARLAESHAAICGISTTHRTRLVQEASAYQIPFATVVHPLARVSQRSTLGAGTIVSVGSIIAAYTHLGEHVFMNRASSIGHHTQVESFVTIQPGVTIAGACRIGTGAYIGMGAVVADRITVGAHSVVGAGAVVVENVPEHVQVAGVPARIVKENVAGR
ncbi:MAG: hypothetical protein NVSMB52_19690 [Chloroflexota bacterium]